MSVVLLYNKKYVTSVSIKNNFLIPSVSQNFNVRGLKNEVSMTALGYQIRNSKF